MPRNDSQRTRVGEWKRKIDAADKVYRDWETEYGARDLEAFVVKSQMFDKSRPGNRGKTDPYIVNLLLPSLLARVPSLMFTTPHVIVEPREAKSDDTKGEATPVPGISGLGPVDAPIHPVDAESKAQLRQDILNTIIQDKRSGFRRETSLAVLDSFFRFGVVEVYYTAGVEKVRAQAPTESAVDTGQMPDQKTEGDAPPLRRVVKPGTERVMFRRIPARCFRVSAASKNDLARCDWSGYYEWRYNDDVKSNPNYANRSGLKSTASVSRDMLGTSDETHAPADDMVKLWKIWDHRERKRYVFVEGEEKFLIDGEEFEFLPYSTLKFVDVLDEFLPVPPTSTWKGAQIEYNETRDAQRTHRRRAARKYIARGEWQDEELAKLASPEDMAIAKAPAGSNPLADMLQPVNPAPMDAVSGQSIALTLSEIAQVTRVGGEQRQAAQSKTATQAQIIQVNKQVQDSVDREAVADWLSDLCWIALRLVEQNFTFGMLVKTSVDVTGAGARAETARVSRVWRKIESDDMGDLEYEVTIDIESLAPANSTLVAQQWNGLLALLSNPTVLTILSRSEMLARKLLGVYGIRGEEDVQELIAVARSIVPQGPPPGAPQAGTQPGVPGVPGIPGGDGLNTAAAGGGVPPDLAALLGSLQGGENPGAV